MIQHNLAKLQRCLHKLEREFVPTKIRNLNPGTYKWIYPRKLDIHFCHETFCTLSTHEKVKLRNDNYREKKKFKKRKRKENTDYTTLTIMSCSNMNCS